MDVNFRKSSLDCMEFALREIQNGEQTQEIKLPDGMPDIGHVVAAWGQPVLRGKEWRSDSISFSGGMMVWVLYAPEDGSALQCIDTWIPFQMRWDLPEGTADGVIRIQCLTRFVDGRSVSPRKILVRAGLGAAAEALTGKTVEVYTAPGEGSEAQLLRSHYPLRLFCEAGEKCFPMEETLLFPDSAPKPEKILAFRIQPQAVDKKVLGNKVVFRGNGNLQVLYRSEEGQYHSWKFELPFSQFSELEGEYGTDAQADLVLMPTNLELEMDDEGQLQLKSSLSSQYVITDVRQVETVEDAYCPGREVSVTQEMLELPVVLEQRWEKISAEQQLNAAANITVDANFMPDFPRVRRMPDSAELEIPGMLQLLYYGEDGALHSVSSRWESTFRIPADDHGHIRAVPGLPRSQTDLRGDRIQVRTEIPVKMQTVTEQKIPMVTGVSLGEQSRKDPDRPSLILRRAGEERLWDLAKQWGSTVEAIRRANRLQEEPVPGQMLLIPVS